MMEDRFLKRLRKKARKGLRGFRYRSVEISNHNALLREMQGVDGIKTGYTEASGYG